VPRQHCRRHAATGCGARAPSTYSQKPRSSSHIALILIGILAQMSSHSSGDTYMTLSVRLQNGSSLQCGSLGFGFSVAAALSSHRQHLSCGGCLEVKWEYYQNCCMLCCVWQSANRYAHRYEQFLNLCLLSVYSIMINVTWRHFDQSAKQLIVGHTTNCIETTQQTCMKSTYTSSKYKCQLQSKKTSVDK